MKQSTTLQEFNIGRALMMSQPDKYEEFVLAACIKCEDLWRDMSKVLCVSEKEGIIRYINDFSSQTRYILYRGLCICRSASEEYVTVTAPFLEVVLNTFVDNPEFLVVQEDVNAAIELFNYLNNNFEEGSIKAIVKDTWITWITNVQALRQLMNLKRTGVTQDITERIADINSIAETIANKVKTEEKTTFSIDDILLQDETIIERIPLGYTFKGLNSCLGGGFGKKEHVLFVVPTGRGKTVISCQVAVEVASAGRHVLLISTEQHPEELVPRMVSCCSFSSATSSSGRIPFDIIKDGITKQLYETKLTLEQKVVIQEFSKSLNPYIHIENWVASDKKVTDIPSILERVNKTLPEGESIDMVILDWIGGAITDGVTDSSVKRNLLYLAAKEMHKIAYKYNVACMSTAQASKDALGRSEVTSEHIADCKSMANEAEVAFGLSAIRAASANKGEAEKDSYSDYQRLYCFKARKSTAKNIEVKCNFAYQRFDKM